jgi:hypothetical protein
MINIGERGIAYQATAQRKRRDTTSLTAITSTRSITTTCHHFPIGPPVLGDLQQNLWRNHFDLLDPYITAKQRHQVHPDAHTFGLQHRPRIRPPRIGNRDWPRANPQQRIDRCAHIAANLDAAARGAFKLLLGKAGNLIAWHKQQRPNGHNCKHKQN